MVSYRHLFSDKLGVFWMGVTSLPVDWQKEWPQGPMWRGLHGFFYGEVF
jgi:hypothetical protein